ncbi:thioredoxin family protein [Paraferrimonas sedimenticola]|uniref:Thioredoxin domain-containing protein n=1 Tax=Paraferrimonas sedimenticola TaxID=375674 RepID=A0AA37RTP1_9GAMM|nr:thioredoxin family protein [Paraferrimonas sedimenticola]GLP95495.1 hypothetical protein GCM10007895_08010 [Paraferrimonas sedimenticola]
MSFFRNTIRSTITLAAGFVFSFAALAGDFNKRDFDKALFDKLQAQGTPVLIDVYAPWCPTCKKQQKVLAEYFAQHPLSPVQVLVVDYDNQKQWVKHFKAPRQSTLYLYQNGEQLWFSVAETRQKPLFSALNSVEM